MKRTGLNTRKLRLLATRIIALTPLEAGRLAGGKDSLAIAAIQKDDTAVADTAIADTAVADTAAGSVRCTNVYTCNCATRANCC